MSTAKYSICNLILYSTVEKKGDETFQRGNQNSYRPKLSDKAIDKKNDKL